MAETQGESVDSVGQHVVCTSETSHQEGSSHCVRDTLSSIIRTWDRSRKGLFKLWSSHDINRTGASYTLRSIICK